uniref:MHC class I-like antigen recognition-like domain-containing protein n=1 Tax=Equus asinus TaxID=9793 RepID=A0A8C4KWM9_EQUAS
TALGPTTLCFIWSPPCPRAHSLHYNLTVVSQDGSVQSGFFAEGQLDGQPFLSYDSEKSRAEPQGLWAEAVLGAETWDAEAEDLMEKGKDLKMTLADVMALQDQKGVYQSSPQTLAMEIKNPGTQITFKARITVPMCREREQGLATSLTGFVLSFPVPSSVNVTRSHDWEGIVTLTCWTFGFFPILSQDAQQSGGVLPDGNDHKDSPRRRAEFHMPRGTQWEPHCTPSSFSGKAPVQQSGWPTILLVAAVAQSGFGATEGEFLREYKIIFWNQVNICLPPIPPEVVSLQVLDQHQRAPTDLSGTMPLGFQSGAWNLQPGGQNSAPCSGLTSTFPLGASVSSSKKWKR